MKPFSFLCGTLAISSWTRAFTHHSSIRSSFVQTTQPWTTPHDSWVSTKLSMSLQPVYDELCNTVASRLGLQRTDFTDQLGASTWQASSGVQGAADWWSETSPKFLTGVTTCTRKNAGGGGSGGAMQEELTINIWMGPSYDVPHMLLTFGQAGASDYHITADYVPRGATVMGGDPQYLEAYFGAPVQAAWNSAYQAGMALPPTPEFDLRLLDSPVKLSVTGLSASQAETLSRDHLNRFLTFVDAAQPIAARLRGSFNLRDDKLRQFYYKGQLAKQVASLGPELGPTVAAVVTGPTAEAYVGGGS